MAEAENTPLDPPPDIRANRYLNQAIWCAALPLGIAILLCAGWWWFRATAFALAGLGLLTLGLCTFIAGVICLMRAGTLARLCPVPPDGKFGRRRTFATFLLMGNLPTAAACIAFGIAFVRPLVFIGNDTGKLLSRVEIVDRIGSQPATWIGDLQPGKIHRLDRNYHVDTGIYLRAVLDGRPIEAQLNSFDIGAARMKIRILPDGRIETTY